MNVDARFIRTVSDQLVALRSDIETLKTECDQRDERIAALEAQLGIGEPVEDAPEPEPRLEGPALAAYIGSPRFANVTKPNRVIKFLEEVAEGKRRTVALRVAEDYLEALEGPPAQVPDSLVSPVSVVRGKEAA